MKQIIVFLLLLLPIVGWSQDTVTDSVEISEVVELSETERLIDKYTGKMFDFAETTAKALERPAKEIFESVVKLQVAKGIGLLLLPLFTIILFIFTINRWIYANSHYKESLKSDFSDVPGGTTSIIFIVATIIFTGASIPSIYWGLQFLIAPEWWGIKEIIGLF